MSLTVVMGKDADLLSALGVLIGGGSFSPSPVGGGDMVMLLRIEVLVGSKFVTLPVCCTFG